jgi:hypothetical protein
MQMQDLLKQIKVLKTEESDKVTALRKQLADF